MADPADPKTFPQSDEEARVAIVTGGGSGIGAAIAVALAKDGWRVVVVGRREPALHETMAEAPAHISCVACDVTDRAEVESLVADTIAKFGHVDVLVNSAGTNCVKRTIRDTDPADWERLVSVNASGAFHTIQTLVPHMAKRGQGLIVNISSVAGRRALPIGGVAYNASKFAMTALGTSVGEEEKDNGIRVTNIYPGEVETPILDDRPVPVSKEHRARILQPEDVAAAVLMVCKLPQRARVPELAIVPTIQSFV